MSEFFDEFNAELETLEDNFGETWIFNGVEYSAISIDDLQLTKIAGAQGGPFIQISVSVFVRKSVFLQSGVVKGNIIEVRSQRVRVITTANDGDDSITLICGPAGIRLPE